VISWFVIHPFVEPFKTYICNDLYILKYASFLNNNFIKRWQNTLFSFLLWKSLKCESTLIKIQTWIINTWRKTYPFFKLPNTMIDHQSWESFLWPITVDDLKNVFQSINCVWPAKLILQKKNNTRKVKLSLN
jgi:hypothetical protein